MDKETPRRLLDRPGRADEAETPTARPVEVVLETSFNEYAPAYIVEAEELLDTVLEGRITLLDAARRAKAPVRDILNALKKKIDISPDAMKDARRMQIMISLMNPINRAEAHHAVKLSQTEDALDSGEKHGSLPKELGEMVAKAIEEKKKKKDLLSKEREEE